MKPVPILFLSDSPELSTGLSRITKDLATQTATLPQFRVGTMGRGGAGSARIPVAQYNFPESAQWGEEWIEGVWEDFSRGEKGIIMTVWDLSRLHWFTRPQMGGRLERFLRGGKFERWGYVPVDGFGVGGRLTGLCADTLRGFDRVLAYTLFGKDTIEQTMGDGQECEWLPHGFNEKVFMRRDRAGGRAVLGVGEKDVVVGCVMTNQARKDWGTAFGAMAHLRSKVHNLKFWVHVDVLERSWSVPALIADFGLKDVVVVTEQGRFTSEQLSYLYSACDVTMLPSLGEGWGFPITESLACGVPCVHGNWGGGREQVPSSKWLVEASGERLEGLWNMVRPVWDPVRWSERVGEVIEEVRVEGDSLREMCEASVEHLRWGNLWKSSWRKWMLKGLEKESGK